MSIRVREFRLAHSSVSRIGPKLGFGSRAALGDDVPDALASVLVQPEMERWRFPYVGRRPR